MAKTTGWSPCGARLVDHAPFGHWQTQKFIAALRHDRLDAPLAIVLEPMALNVSLIGGPINREFFDLYFETQLAPTLQKGDVVILDNLATHLSPKAATILKDIGAWFLFLPPYSPDQLPDLLWETDPAIFSFIFGDLQVWRRLFPQEWAATCSTQQDDNTRGCAGWG